MFDLVTRSADQHHLLPVYSPTGSLGVIVQIAAALATALYAINAVGRGRGSVRRSALLIVLLCGLAALGPAWAVQSGAGLSLWGLVTVVFASLSKSRVRRRLMVSAIGVLIFAALGAEWVLIPFAVMLVLRAWGLLSGGGKGCARAGDDQRGRGPRTRPVDLGKRPVADTAAAAAFTDLGTGPGLEIYFADDRLPIEARDLLRQIDERSTAASAYLAAQGRGNAVDAIEVERIRSDYAPGAVRGYLALPPWSAHDTVLTDGKTGSHLLVEQLGLLVHRLRQTQDSVALTGGEELLTHGRFLRHRFPAPGADDLRL